jgi:DNA-directed RNA polymerase specialized sigma24 family protein
LPKEQRDVFVLSEIDGCSVKEIAAKTGAPVNTVLSRKHYAVLFLRKRLAELYADVMG